MDDKIREQQESWQNRPQSEQRANHSPARAALCGLVMGLGAVYNREYTKAVIHFSIFAGLVILADSVGVFGFAAFVFYLFTIIDAYRSAEVIERRLQENPDYRSPEESVNLPLWGGLLVAMGVLFLLENMGVFSVASVVRFWWPLILIGLGLYLILIRGKSRSDIHSSTPPPAPVRQSGPRGTEGQSYE